MLTQNDLVARWRAIPQYNGGYQLVDATHPLHWYVGYSDVGRRTPVSYTHLTLPTT